MSEWLSLTTKFPTCIVFMNIQESKPENQDKVRNLPLKMKGTEQSVTVIEYERYRTKTERHRHLLEEKRIGQQRNHQRVVTVK